MMFCLDDGAELLYGPATSSGDILQTDDGPATAILSEPRAVGTGSAVRGSAGAHRTKKYLVR